MTVRILKPTLDTLPGYRAALERGWSPDTIRSAETAKAQIAAIADDPAGFVDRLEDREARRGPVRLPDGSSVKRIPGFARWIWEGGLDDGAFCGSISFRWQKGTTAPPPHVLGHVGYTVVPWKRGRGNAAKALRLLLPEIAGLGLPHIDITTDPDNVASQKVALSAGARFITRKPKPPAFGDGEVLLFRIDFASQQAPD